MFAWRYRASNNEAASYEPDWDHSTQLELVIWAAPLLIVICLGAVTWTGTHLLDPYRPIGRIAKGQAPCPPNATPLEVQVVALDWKWLFIYPQYGFATVNELAAPVDRPIRIPPDVFVERHERLLRADARGNDLYAMPSMETKLHAVINKVGRLRRLSPPITAARGSRGCGSASTGWIEAGFDAWVATNRAAQVAAERAPII